MTTVIPLNARYTADLVRAMRAGETWCEQHPGAHLLFRAFDEGATILCSLHEVADDFAQGDAEARAFLDQLIVATEYRCTYQQACAVIRELFDRVGGHGGDA